MKHVKQCQSKGNDTICIDVMVDLSRLIRQRFMIDEVERRTSRALQRGKTLDTRKCRILYFTNANIEYYTSQMRLENTIFRKIR